MSEFLKVVQAVKAGNTALAQWQKTEINERIQKLELSYEIFHSMRAALLKALSKETGALEDDNLDLEVAISQLQPCLAAISQAANDTETNFLPVGLVGLITGAKNPFSAAIQRITIALALGNAVIWKPSEQLQQTSKMITEVYLKLGLPDGLLTVIEAESKSQSQGIAEAIVDHPAIHQLMFVGSSEVGKIVYARAAQNSKRIQGSMGSRNAAIIFADTELDSKLEEIVRTFFDFHGLGRWRASRIFVQESIYKEFIEKLQKLLSETQLKYLGKLSVNRLEKFNMALKQALDEKGKSLLDASKNLQDLQPAVIYDLTNCSTLQQEEIDGPMITVSSFKYQFDAIKFANTSPLGKIAYVWTSDSEKAKKVARKLEVGRVFINQIPKDFAGKRFVGAKESGVGGEGILDLIEFNSYKVNVT